MLNLLLHELRVRRWAIIGWGLGLITFISLYLPIYPAIQEQIAAFDVEAFALYQAMGVTSMATLEGYISSTIVQFLPILLGIFAVISGVGALAGEEESGTLELIVATPLARWQIVSVKGLAMLIAMLLILLMTGLGGVVMFMMVEGQVETTLTAMNFFWAMMSSLPLVLAFMMISFFLGVYLPSRRVASAAATLFFIVSYFGNSLANLSEQLQPLRPLFLFSYFDGSPQLFVDGVNGADVALLLATAVLFFLLTLLSFQRRNITVGAWPWQRPVKVG